MNSKDLSTFLWVAELGSICRAAEHLQLSQPTVSARIAKLEKLMDKALIEQSSGGERCTRAGNELMVLARQSSALQSQMQQQVFDAKTAQGEFRLGVAETVAQAWLPELLQSIQQSFPKVQVSVTVDRSDKLREQLVSHDLDLAVLMGSVSEQSVKNKALPSFELAWYRSAKQSCAKHCVPDQPVVSFAQQASPHCEVMNALQQQYGTELRVFPSSSLSACLKMIESGLGVGAVPRVLGDAACERGELKKLDMGWQPPALAFTASYISSAGDLLAQKIAALAAAVAQKKACSL